MSEFTTFADLGYTLQQLLQNGLDEVFGLGIVTVTQDSPKTIEDESRSKNNLLSIYLYKIIENSDLKNHPSYEINTNNFAPAPLACDLYYMITAYGKDEKNKLAILGRTMQILYDSSILQGSILEDASDLPRPGEKASPPNNNGNLKGSSEQIKVTITPLTQETITQIWQAMEITMRVAIFYIVTPVKIDSTRTLEVKRASERKLG